MSRCRTGRWIVSILTVAAIIASCGGGDGGGDDGAAPANADTADTAGTVDPSEPATSPADVASADAGGEVSDDSAATGATGSCDDIFSMAEMEEFFAEPVGLTEDTNDSLGQLVCTWESIEDPADMEDLAFKVLTVQLYSGSPVDASAFFDPSIFESVTTIEGIGDLAYTADSLGPSFYFVDEPVGGSMSYSEVDMGDTDAPKLHTAADVEALFRTFHDRVT